MQQREYLKKQLSQLVKQLSLLFDKKTWLA